MSAPAIVREGLDQRSKAVPILTSIPLTGLEPGEYDCQVTVLEPGGGRANFWRAPITVVP